MAQCINEVSFYRFGWTLAAGGDAEHWHLKPTNWAMVVPQVPLFTSAVSEKAEPLNDIILTICSR